MHASSSHGLRGRILLRRLLLVSASLTIGTIIYFLLGDPDGLVAEEKLLPAAHAASPAPATVIAHVDGVAITEEDVVVDVAGELAALEERRRRVLHAALESRIADQLVVAEAESRGVSVDELLALEVDAKLDLVDEAEIQARLGAGAVDVASGDAVDETELRRQLRYDAFIHELREAAAVSVYGEPGL